MSKGAGAILCGVMALVMTFGGFFMAGIPVIGAIIAFAAPAVGLAGIILGGLGIKEAKARGQEQGAATTGLVISILGFVLGLVVALTCGLCNACMTASMGGAGVAAGGALAGAAEAAQQAQQQQQQQRAQRMQQAQQGQPLPPPPGPSATTGSVEATVLGELNAECQLPGHPCNDHHHWDFTALTCPSTDPSAICTLSFTTTSKASGESRTGTMAVPRADLLLQPDGRPDPRYLAPVTRGVLEWLVAQGGQF